MSLPICCLNLSSAVAKKLLDSGFIFAEDVFLSKKEFHPKVEKILNADLKKILLECANAPKTTSALNILKVEQKTSKIITFSYKLDKILGGGIPTGVLTEICGAPGSGKTQLCLQLCINIQLHASLGGLQAEAVYIDTDAGFSPQRLQEIARGSKEHCCKVAKIHNFSSDTIKWLENQSYTDYYYFSAFDCSKLMSIIFNLESFIKEHNKVKLVIIDSLAFCFLQLTDMLQRTTLLCKVLTHLKRIAAYHNLSVIVTNYLTTRISRLDQFTPALGECVGYLMDHRLMLGFLPVDANFASVIFKSPILPSGSAVFQVTSSGVRDAS